MAEWEYDYYSNVSPDDEERTNNNNNNNSTVYFSAQSNRTPHSKERADLSIDDLVSLEDLEEELGGSLDQIALEDGLLEEAASKPHISTPITVGSSGSKTRRTGSFERLLGTSLEADLPSTPSTVIVHSNMNTIGSNYSQMEDPIEHDEDDFLIKRKLFPGTF